MHIRAIAGIVGAVLSLISIFSTSAAGQGRGTVADLIVPHPSWSCGLPSGIPNPESGTVVFEAELTLDRIADLGQTPYGRRQVAVVREGALAGTRFTGSVMAGALDLQLTLANGVIEIEHIAV